MQVIVEKKRTPILIPNEHSRNRTGVPVLRTRVQVQHGYGTEMAIQAIGQKRDIGDGILSPNTFNTWYEQYRTKRIEQITESIKRAKTDKLVQTIAAKQDFEWGNLKQHDLTKMSKEALHEINVELCEFVRQKEKERTRPEWIIAEVVRTTIIPATGRHITTTVCLLMSSKTFITPDHEDFSKRYGIWKRFFDQTMIKRSFVSFWVILNPLQGLSIRSTIPHPILNKCHWSTSPNYPDVVNLLKMMPMGLKIKLDITDKIFNEFLHRLEKLFAY